MRKELYAHGPNDRAKTSSTGGGADPHPRVQKIAAVSGSVPDSLRIHSGKGSRNVERVSVGGCHHGLTVAMWQGGEDETR